MYSSRNTETLHTSISYTDIINSCDQLDLWSWFFGFRVELGQPVCNPMRVDRHPNCSLSWGLVKKDFIVLNDFTDRRYHGSTIFDAMMAHWNLRFNQVCEKIYEEFMVGRKIRISSTPQFKSKEEEFQFILYDLPWTLNNKNIFIKKDKQYWQQYEIGAKELKEDGVTSNRAIVHNTRKNPRILRRLETSPSYTYHFGDKKKCYNPYHETKWLSTCTENEIGGLSSMTRDDLIITKSYKDWRVLANSGYNTIWLQTESCLIPFEQLIQFREIKNKYILFDNDVPGRTCSQNLAKYCNQFDNSYIPVWFDLDMPKDAADVVKKYSTNTLEQELSNLGIQ